MKNIEFVSIIEHLEKIEDCVPKPAKNFIPKWFKDMPGDDDGPTAKHCPSFPDYFSQGYVLPMWSDVNLQYSPETGEWNWNSRSKYTFFENHPNGQFVKYAEPYFQDSPGKFVFKVVSPWKIITPPGWSVLQLPLFYHFNKEWSVLPGVIDTDIFHAVNQQILYHGDGQTITIERGTPLALYIPFQRSKKLNLKVRSATDKDNNRFDMIDLDLFSKFAPNYTYRKMQRDRDKDGR